MQVSKKQEKQNELIDKFNSTITGMINHVVKYHDDDFTNCKKLIDISIFANPKLPINMFLEYIYKNDEYRVNIREQNESFFMKELDKESKNKNQDYEMMTKLFEFKTLWSKIDLTTKNFIKKSMMILVLICDKYIISL